MMEMPSILYVQYEMNTTGQNYSSIVTKNEFPYKFVNASFTKLIAFERTQRRPGAGSSFLAEFFLGRLLE